MFSLYCDYRQAALCEHLPQRHETWQREQPLGGGFGELAAIVTADEVKQRDENSGEPVLPGRPRRREPFEYLTQALDVACADLEITHLILDECTWRKKTGIPRMASNSGVAYFASLLPITRIDRQKEKTGGRAPLPPAVAQLFGRLERRSRMKTRSLGLPGNRKRAGHGDTGADAAAVIVNLRRELLEPRSRLNRPLQTQVHPFDLDGARERPSLEGRVTRSLGDCQSPVEGAPGSVVVGVGCSQKPPRW